MTTANLSYVRGGKDVPLLDDTIGAAFDATVVRYADREALVVRHQEVRWTWRELAGHVDSMAANLLNLGIEPGERIGIWAQNNAEWVVTQFATAKAGFILVNINPAYRRTELEYALNLVGCKALILSPSFKASNYLEILRSIAPEIEFARPGELRSASLPALRYVIRLGHDRTAGMMNFGELLERPDERSLARLREVSAGLRANDSINVQFTSGTTGAPKGATLTHRNILNNGYFVGSALHLSAADRLCIPVPLYHCFGMVLGNLACMTHGSTMVYPDESFNAESVLQTVQAERCTALHGVPTMFIAVLDHPSFGDFDLRSLRTGIMAGAPCPISVMEKVVERMHMREVTIYYGMTETAPVSFQSSADDPVERRVSSVGRILPHLEVKLVDAEGNIVPRGMPGELCTRGYSVMRGYWADEARTREAIDVDGWMHSGDLATLDDAGYCNIVGRSKDMVIRGGENIYPREVEEFLYRHPKIQDVQCVGVPDAKYGEELCACVVLRAGTQASAEEIREFCKGEIAHYKIPRYVRFVEGFPMTITGKIRKNELRAQMARELSLKADRTA
jgi:fatty-acyl-CoA synthase